MSRRFLVEAEELSRRAPEVLYHGGAPALWALVLIEAGEDLERQAFALYSRMFDREDSALRRFAVCLQRAYVQQREALLPGRDFGKCRAAALDAIAEGTGIADELAAKSAENEERRNAQAAALRDMLDMKKLEED